MDIEDYLKLDFRYYLKKHISTLKDKKNLFSNLRTLLQSRKNELSKLTKKFKTLKQKNSNLPDFKNELLGDLKKCKEGRLLSSHFCQDPSIYEVEITDFAGYGENWAIFDFYKEHFMNETQENSLPSVFISHSSDDRDIVQSFIDKILLLGIGLKREQIFCTSSPGMDIDAGEDFKDHIIEKLQKASVIILFITSNYKRSEVCQNEMGAAVMTNARTFPMILPPITYNNVGFLHSANIQLKLDERKDILKFSNELSSFCNLRVNLSTLDDQITLYLKDIENNAPFSSQLSTHGNSGFSNGQDKVLKEYFKKFLQKDVDFRILMLRAQPTLSDCKAIFQKNYYESVYDYCNLFYKSVVEQNDILESIRTKDSFIYEVIDYPEIKKKTENSEAKRGFLYSLNSNVIFYHIKFISQQEEHGYSLYFWCYIDNRWIFFPKPWRYVQNIDRFRESDIYSKMLGIMKKFGLHKQLQSMDMEADIFMTTLIRDLRRS